ncbi:hypothetical protein [Paraburkholderia tagetis]|uniref:hypothetical protein n=1 Tax=Paraburkholderia tagetis TaxID=2913261 RepID=UPI001EE4B573|nr:hypothetical protein [Paraburkholderia tagetis]
MVVRLKREKTVEARIDIVPRNPPRDALAASHVPAGVARGETGSTSGCLAISALRIRTCPVVFQAFWSWNNNCTFASFAARSAPHLPDATTPGSSGSVS